jgi:hypothetical protein
MSVCWGAISLFPASQIWTAFAEPKCRFFTWDCNPTCSLCSCLPETADHLLAKCNFMEVVWNLTASQFNLHNYVTMAASGDYSEWVRLLVASGTKRKEKKRKKNKAWYPLLFWWQVWKERNSRFFQGEEHSSNRVAALIKEQVISNRVAALIKEQVISLAWARSNQNPSLN